MTLSGDIGRNDGIAGGIIDHAIGNAEPDDPGDRGLGALGIYVGQQFRP